MDSVSNYNDKFEEINQRVEDGNKLTLEILQALKPSALTGKGGIIQNVEHIEKRMDKFEEKLSQLEKVKDKVFWTITVIASLATIIITAAALYAIFKP